MKINNIIRNLKKDGFKIIYKKWGYWDSIPHIPLDGFDFAIVEGVTINNSYTINMDFVYNHVLDATTTAENVNYYILRLIEANPKKTYEYEIYLITSMQDYYKYLKREFPWDYWENVKKYLKEEHKKIFFS